MDILRRAKVIVGICACAAAAIAPPAGAAWTPPQEILGSNDRYPLLAAYGPGAAPSIAMYGPIELFPGNPQAPVAISSILSGAAYAPPVSLRDGLGAPLAVSPNGTLLAVGGPRSPLDYFMLEGRRSRLRVGIGPVNAGLRRIPTNGIVATRTLASAVNDSGDAAVVFSRCIDKECETRSVLATFRRRGRSFGAPVVLAKRTGYPAAAVALNANGDAIVAWIQHRAQRRGNDIRTRMRRANGTLTKVRIAGPTAPVPTIAVTLSGRRHGVVSWFSHPVSEGSVGGSLAVYRSDMSSGGALGKRRLVDSGTPTGHGEADAVGGARLRAILGADGVTTVAWTGFAAGHYVVRAERYHREVGQVETISPPNVDAQLMDFAGDSAGDALAVWSTLPGAAAPGVAAVIRPAAATTFGVPQLVLFGADVSGTAVGAIASGGRAVVVGGQAQQGGRLNPPGVRVTHLIG
jgi:hypothetical protein